MFTGLVADIGTITRRRHDGDNTTISIETDFDTDDIDIGESIAVDGACLTVTAIGDNTFDVDASPETLERTTLGDRSVGDGVHLERALRLSDRLGGHIVSGHVDGLGTLRDKTRDGNAWILTIEAPDEVALYLIEKGSITVDGISLTINGVDGNRFDLAIIPHTAEQTLIGDYEVGRSVNLEADIIGKYVHKFASDDRNDIRIADLVGAGFL